MTISVAVNISFNRATENLSFDIDFSYDIYVDPQTSEILGDFSYTVVWDNPFFSFSDFDPAVSGFMENTFDFDSSVYLTLGTHTFTINASESWEPSNNPVNIVYNVIMRGQSAANESNNGTAGVDIIIGGSGVNTMTLGNGSDYAFGGGGADWINGQSGNDIIFGEDGSDTLRGSIGHDQLFGGAAGDIMYGGDHNDLLDGGSGNDTMEGEQGNDTYVVDQSGDIIVEAAGGGTDTVRSFSSSYTLAANVENGIIATSGASNMTGNTLNNTFRPGTGNNIINGHAGSDTVSYDGLVSGVTVRLDVLTPQAITGSGLDTLLAIENLIGTSSADNLTGNSVGNRLDGQNNVLGSLGDRMTGLGGNDTYAVDDNNDIVVETDNNPATGGFDTVESILAAYTLAANVERGIILADFAGIVSMTGNAGKNVIVAGNGNNLINGAGDTDTVSYERANAAVTVTLASTNFQNTGGSGTDKLISIESIIGSRFGDTLTGNTGANTMNGGLGNDILIGGGGADGFVFNTALGATNRDTIQGFAVADDTIYLDNAVFTALGAAGVFLPAGAFNTGAAATQADDRIIYNTATRALLYDADGFGGAAAIQFATLTAPVGTLGANDFFII